MKGTKKSKQLINCKHDWIEALPPPFDFKYTPDICAKCGKKRLFNRDTLRYERYDE